MVGLLRRNDGGVGDQGEVDPWVGHQVSLELIQINIQGTIEPQGSRDGRDNLADQSVEVGVGWTVNIEVPSADIVDGLVVHHEGTVRVLEGCVGAKGRGVGLDHSSCHLSMA